MEQLTFTYSAKRAAKARYGKALSGRVRVGLLITISLLALSGVGCLAIGLSLGWSLIGLAAPIIMVLVWHAGELRKVPVAKNACTIDGLLETDVLCQLQKSPSSRDIATAAGSVQSGLFFGARFGITVRFLQDISETITDPAAIWQMARNIQQEVGGTSISGGMIAVAIVRLFPNYERVLASIKLNDADLMSGIKWHVHIQELIAQQARAKRTGGIARDWSFGYIPLLTRFGQNLSEQIAHGGLLTVELEAHMKALEQMVDTFGTRGRQNVALLGAIGSGKTSIVQSFAERLLDASTRLPADLKFRQIFMLDASSLIAAAPGQGELEQLISHLLNEAYNAKNIILCLDNAELFFEEGIGSVDLANVLLPILEAGRLRIILTMDEQRFLKISHRNSALANALNRIIIEPASHDETIAVLQDQLIITEFQRNVTYTYQSLEEAYRLSERYIHDLAMPGRAVTLLRSAASYAESGLVTMNSVQQAIEQTQGIKISEAGADEREKLLNLEDLIHKRMINQTRAVTVVSDALRRARAGVRSQNRPIGTFLFLGPTGVGKTELAKALADVYFGGERRMIRLDMNEFVRPEDVARLIADGADDPGSLTAQIMKQPFSVVLLDEIEKAHPQVLTTLLQLLDEGILRDIKNREVSFRDAIVIATSNAGADRIREYLGRGYKLEQFEDQFVNELITSNQFRPEFLNRFDEIVTFRPLTEDELLQVVDLIIAGINKTLAVQKVSVNVDDDAKRLLVQRGNDPLLGARPMRRIVQRAVENTVAKQMLSGSVAAGGEVHITLDQVHSVVGAQTTARQIAEAPSSDSGVQPL